MHRKPCSNRIRAGEARAAEAIYDRYCEKLLALARRRISRKLSARLDPDDVVQSAYRSFFLRARRGEFSLGRNGDLWRFGPVGKWTDVYGLGALLYSLLTRRPPFAGASVAEVLSQLTSATAPAPPIELRPDMPAELSEICMRALSKRPASRFASARKFADALSLRPPCRKSSPLE